MRYQLIECATTRPNDVSNFYLKYLNTGDDGCSYLEGPERIALFYKGKLRYYDATLVPFALAGVNPKGRKTCGHANCINPDHVARML